MNNRPKVSVLLAAYNSNTTIFESIQSVLVQTYPRLELIVCDDGTEGFDCNGIEKFAQAQGTHVEIKIVHQPENVGTVRNLNAGLQQADGEWIVLLAADDCFSSEEAIAHLVGKVQAGGQRWGIARTALCDESLNPRGWSVPSEEVAAKILDGNTNALYLQLCSGCCLPAGGAIYHIDLLRELNGFDETYRLTEDWPIFLKLVRRGLLPAISEKDIVLHRFGGVSRKKAGKNFVYQRDLITVLREEVVPHIALLDKDEQKTIRKLVQEKEMGYEFRFSCPTLSLKLVWAIKHPLFILRKILHRREKIC